MRWLDVYAEHDGSAQVADQLRMLQDAYNRLRDVSAQGTGVYHPLNSVAKLLGVSNLAASRIMGTVRVHVVRQSYVHFTGCAMRAPWSRSNGKYAQLLKRRSAS